MKIHIGDFSKKYLNKNNIVGSGFNSVLIDWNQSDSFVLEITIEKNKRKFLEKIGLKTKNITYNHLNENILNLIKKIEKKTETQINVFLVEKKKNDVCSFFDVYEIYKNIELIYNFLSDEIKRFVNLKETEKRVSLIMIQGNIYHSIFSQFLNESNQINTQKINAIFKKYYKIMKEKDFEISEKFLIASIKAILARSELESEKRMCIDLTPEQYIFDEENIYCIDPFFL